jgi:cysteine-rich repeat protein
MEVCDDGNNVSGDECPEDCRARCGDGVVHAGESCDDMNDVPGDGCNLCRTPGQQVWSVGGCEGDLAGFDHTILALCRDGEDLVRQYSFRGELLQSWPRSLIDDPLEMDVLPRLVAATEGMVFVAAEVRRNRTSGSGGQYRTRIAALAFDGTLAWTRDVTVFPGGPDERPVALAYNNGRLAIATSDSPAAVNVLDAASPLGPLVFRYTAGSYTHATSVGLDESGFTYLGVQTLFGSGLAGVDRDGGEVYYQGFEESYSRDGVVFSIAPLAAGSARLIGATMIEDPLVPTPPRSTIRAWTRGASTTTVDVSDTPWYSESFDGTNVEDLPVRRFGFSEDGEARVYGWGGDTSTGTYRGFVGYGATPTATVWTISQTIDPVTMRDTLLYEDLFCVTRTTPSLVCYLAR